MARQLRQKNKKKNKKKKAGTILLTYLCTGVLLLLAFLWAVNTGSIAITGRALLRGLFVEYDANVATIYDLRFPRIIISLLAGAALAVSGNLFQTVLKNPLTDPGIIGISGGASFAAVVMTACAPALFQWTPLFAFIGGMLAFLIVYSLAWKGGLSPLRIVLVGVAVSTMFSGMSSALNSMSGGNQSSVAAIVSGSISMKTWDDVRLMLCYVPPCLVIALCMAGICNLFMLEDKTARGIGVNVNRIRIWVSIVAVLLASITTAVVGVVSFIGLLVPHIARILVGNDQKVLMPYSMLLGSLLFLLADTVGRTIAAPYEVSASIIMAVFGGPFFIALLRRRNGYGS